MRNSSSEQIRTPIVNGRSVSFETPAQAPQLAPRARLFSHGREKRSGGLEERKRSRKDSFEFLESDEEYSGQGLLKTAATLQRRFQKYDVGRRKGSFGGLDEEFDKEMETEMDREPISEDFHPVNNLEAEFKEYLKHKDLPVSGDKLDEEVVRLVKQQLRIERDSDESRENQENFPKYKLQYRAKRTDRRRKFVGNQIPQNLLNTEKCSSRFSKPETPSKADKKNILKKFLPRIQCHTEEIFKNNIGYIGLSVIDDSLGDSFGTNYLKLLQSCGFSSLETFCTSLGYGSRIRTTKCATVNSGSLKYGEFLEHEMKLTVRELRFKRTERALNEGLLKTKCRLPTALIQLITSMLNWDSTFSDYDQTQIIRSERGLEKADGQLYEVHKATHSKTGLPVITETFHLEVENSLPEFLKREIQLSEMLADHPNLWRIIDTVSDDYKVMVVRHKVERTLSSVISSNGPINPEVVNYHRSRLRYYLKQLLSLVDACHKKNLMCDGLSSGSIYINAENIIKVTRNPANFYDAPERLLADTDEKRNLLQVSYVDQISNEKVEFLHVNGKWTYRINEQNCLTEAKFNLDEDRNCIEIFGKPCNFHCRQVNGSSQSFVPPSEAKDVFKLLRNPRSHSCKKDIWSLGCVFAKIVLGRWIFHFDRTDSSDIEVLLKIFRTLGTPTPEEWPQALLLHDYFNHFPKFPKASWEELCPTLSHAGLDLLSRMLCFNPDERISANEALDHPFFAEDDFLVPLEK